MGLGEDSPKGLHIYNVRSVSGGVRQGVCGGVYWRKLGTWGNEGGEMRVKLGVGGGGGSYGFKFMV